MRNEKVNIICDATVFVAKSADAVQRSIYQLNIIAKFNIMSLT